MELLAGLEPATYCFPKKMRYKLILVLTVQTQTINANKKAPVKGRLFVWSYWPDLNRRPADYESAALPTEPQ